MSLSPIRRFKQCVRKRPENKPERASEIPEAPHNYIPLVHGVPAETYRLVLRAERAELYATSDRSAKLRQMYNSGLFSAGRPGILAAS